MLVICDKCGLKYKIDPAKIKGERAKLTCRGCSHGIIVTKEDVIDTSSAAEGAGATVDSAERAKSLYDPAAARKSDASTVSQIRKKSAFGLTAKVILTMLLVSLVPGITYFWISFHQTAERIKNETKSSVMQVTEILTDEVDEWVDKNIRVLDTVAKLPAMESMNRASQEAVLKTVQKEYPWMYLVHTIDLNGMNVARSDDEELMDYTGRQYLQDIKSGKALAWQNLIGKTSQKPALVLAVPIKNNGQLVGLLASAMTLEAVTKMVANWRQGQTGRVLIVDQDGRVVAHPDEKMVQEQKDLSKHQLVVAAQNKLQTLVEYEDANKVEMIGFSRKTQLDWTLALQQEKKEAFAALAKAQTTASLLFALTVVGIVIIAYFASQALVKPIRTLTEAANRISVGELSVEIHMDTQDEIGDLADAITRMQDSIRLSIERLRRKKR